MPSNLQLKLMNGVHRFIVGVTAGRFGWDLGGMPVLELTTTGRRSGRKRSTMLTAPVRVGGSYVVVASRGGDHHHPAWYLNLRDDPRVEIRMKDGKRIPRLARIATPDERAALWPQIVKKNPGYGGYQNSTEREIPLVFLEPRE